MISSNSSRQQDSKFLNRIMSSKDIATPNPSFRVYYGAAPGSVPFTWESAPGTPKHHLFSSRDSSNLPPLTPPPSFYSYSNDSRRFRSSAALKLPNFLFRALFPKTSTAASRRGLRSSVTSSHSDQNYDSNKYNCSFSYSSSASSSSSSTSTADVYRKKPWRTRCFSCSRLPSRHHDDELEQGSPITKRRSLSLPLGRCMVFV